MIFNKSVFRKLLKTAYKTAGLLVANKEGRIIIAGTWWVMTMEERVFTKEGKAALVELTGQLPIQGECWRSTGAGNQMEIPPEYLDIDSMYDDVISREPFHKTIVTIDVPLRGTARLYQKGGTVVLLNEVIEMLLDPSAVKEGEDSCVEGPFTQNVEKPETFYWYTDTCSFAAEEFCLGEDVYSQFIKSLSDINIPKLRG